MKRIGMTSAGSIIVEISKEEFNDLLKSDDAGLYEWEEAFRYNLQTLGLSEFVLNRLLWAIRLKNEKLINGKWVECPAYVPSNFMDGKEPYTFHKWIISIAEGSIDEYKLLSIRQFGAVSLEALRRAAKKYVENR